MVVPHFLLRILPYALRSSAFTHSHANTSSSIANQFTVLREVEHSLCTQILIAVVLFCRLQAELNMQAKVELDVEDFFDVELFVNNR